MAPSRTPETLTAVQRAQRLNLHLPPVQEADHESAHAHAHPDQNPMAVTKPSKQEQKIMEQARKSLPPLSGPRASATANLDPRSDAELSAVIGRLWQQRGDRYSEIRTAETAALRKIEMSYIGG